MVKNLFVFIAVIGCVFFFPPWGRERGALAQPYGNEWVNFSNIYYKFDVAADGLYRIPYQTLANAGFPVGSVNPQTIKIFGRGQQLYLYIEGGNDGSLDNGDYIEFYAEKNTGWLDTALYANPNWHANPEHSLFTDTATYFLTWDNFSTTAISVENDTSFSSYTPVSYIFKESRINFSGIYFGGKYSPVGNFEIYDAPYSEGEGWFDPRFYTPISKDVPTDNAYTGAGAPDAQATIVLVGGNMSNHLVNIKFADINTNASYSAIKVNKSSYLVSPDKLGTAVTAFSFSPTPIPTPPYDYNTLSFISVNYPHTLDAGNSSSFFFSLPDNPSESKSYLKFTNFNSPGNAILYDLSNHKRIKIVKNGNDLEALVPDGISGNEKKCLLESESAIQNIGLLRKIGANGTFTDYQTDVVNYDYLIITHRSLLTAAEAYKNYRQLPVVSSYNPLVVDVDELYDQFCYGIRKNPLAIRHYIDFVIDKWDTVPKMLLLFGKAMSSEQARNDAGIFAANLVPTFGYPPSDNLLTAGLTDTLYEPAIPTGRIAARSMTEALDYLQKVMEYESVQLDPQYPQEWIKQVLHFAGGIDAFEQSMFQGYLANLETIIEDTFFGGYVHNFYKKSSAPIESNLADSAVNLINNGVSIMTFIGHSSTTGFDQNLDSPDLYSNTDGKYPFLMAVSCYVGNIHTPPSASTSELWTLHPRGTIAFLASVTLGDAGIGAIYLDTLYSCLSSKYYGSPVGRIIRETIILSQKGNNSEGFIRTYYDMTLHGDPAVIIHSPEKPDLFPKEQEVFYSPTAVTTDMSYFDMTVVITNSGRVFNQPYTVEVIRKFSLGDTAQAFIIVQQSRYKDTVVFHLPVDAIRGAGLNIFEITADASGAIDEMDETNNRITVSLFIKSDDIIPAYPYEFAIVPDSIATLYASTGDPLAPARNYIFQVDTTDSFLAPLAVQTINQSGGVVKWTIPFPLTDSTVYFWRVKPESGANWRESSFEYIRQKRGWGQSHFFQFKKDNFKFITYNKGLRKFDFIPVQRHLFCQAIGNAWGDYLWSENKYVLDLSIYGRFGCCAAHALHVAVIDSMDLEPWATMYQDGGGNPQSANHNFGQANSPCCGCNCELKPYYYFVFHLYDSLQRVMLANMLTDSVPDGNYILAYSFILPDLNKWDNTLLNAFYSLGANSTKLYYLMEDRPFIFLARKGHPEFTPQTIIGDSPYATITADADLYSNYSYGTITSTVIGPAKQWQSLHWRMKSVDAGDKIFLKVIRIDTNGIETPVPELDSLLLTSPDINNLSAYVDAADYPNLKLSLFIQDDIFKTPPQLESWRVLYEGVPEAALNPNIFYAFFDDTMQEGQTLQMEVAVQNISEYDMDSLRVRFWITDKNKKAVGMTYKKLKPLLSAPDTLHASFSRSTMYLPGLNSLWVEVNPLDTLWQSEQYHFNNIAEIPFYVNRDITNPILDVTFDGVHILNGDIVSAKPDILIQLKDENKFLPLDTSNLLSVYIKYPDAATENFIPYDGSTLRFIPASLPDNKAKVEYLPEFTKDGIYELRVRGKDRSGNESGDLDYTISFEVVSRPTITYFLNWPNPFSTATHFVFTLTGSEVPDDIKIQILTITGKVVRELFASDLGQIHIGRNITDFVWDGTDQFGDRLANGVYLYKVTAKLFGQEIEHKETQADKFFKKGFGKMFLMR